MNTTRRHRTGPDTATDPRVAAVLAAAAAPTEPGVQPGEAAALAAFRSTVPALNRRTRMLPSLKAAAVAATATGALLVGGVAAAATGTLPGAAQDSARTVLSNVGVSVPGPNAHAGTHPDGTSAHATDDATAPAAAPATTAPAPVPSPAATEAANAHGKAVSDLAHTTTATGAAKGAEISNLASGGKSRAGDEHGKPTPTTTTTTPAAPDDTPGDAQGNGSNPSGGHGGATHQP